MQYIHNDSRVHSRCKYGYLCAFHAQQHAAVRHLRLHQRLLPLVRVHSFCVVTKFRGLSESGGDFCRMWTAAAAAHDFKVPFPGDGDTVSTLRWNPAGTMLAAGGWDCKVLGLPCWRTVLCAHLSLLFAAGPRVGACQGRIWRHCIIHSKTRAFIWWASAGRMLARGTRGFETRSMGLFLIALCAALTAVFAFSDWHSHVCRCF